jgi:hypothetical protein
MRTEEQKLRSRMSYSKWRASHKDVAARRLREWRKKHFAENPWNEHWKCARFRCVYPYSQNFKNGIKFDMTKEDFKELWFRDKAYLLKRPSIDRIVPEVGYVKSNCRFIELSENARIGNVGRKASEETRAKLSIAHRKSWELRKNANRT